MGGIGGDDDARWRTETPQGQGGAWRRGWRCGGDGCGFIESERDGAERGGIGPMAGGRHRDADAADADEGFELADGFRPAVGLGQLAAEPFALGSAGGGGLGIEFDAGDRVFECQAIEDGEQRAQEVGSVGAGFREADVALPEAGAIEMENEGKPGGGEMAGMEAGGKGMEEAFEEESEGIEGGDGILGFEGLGKGLRWAVETEQSALAMEDGMPVTGPGAEAGDEVRTREFHEIPELPQPPIGQRLEKAFATGDFVKTAEGQGGEGFAAEEVAIEPWMEHGKVGEIRGFRGGAMDFQAIEAGLTPAFAVTTGAAEIDDDEVGPGDFEIGTEGFGEFAEAGEEAGFLLRMAGQEAEVGAADKGAVERPTGGDAGAGGDAVDGEERDF